MRTDCGLNATFARTPARAGNLGLISQSGAICGAILDWAASAEVGFTSVVSLGGAIDVDFGEVLDFLVADEATDAILMYVEGIRDARRYVSALRAAARVKPVVALKVGRYADGSRAASSHTGALVGSDAVFDAALRRAGRCASRPTRSCSPRRACSPTGAFRRRAPRDRHQRRRPGRGRRRQRGTRTGFRSPRCRAKP
jgi:acetyltransferase